MSVTRARPSKPSPEEVPGAEGFLPARRTLPTLRAAIPTCRGCTLYKHATQAVFGEGSAASRVMLIGEVPGDREDVLGKPFVGPAGRLLDEALAIGGIPRDEVYVTNAVKHFKWEPRGKRRLHAKPSAREIAACLPWLELEVELVRPIGLMLLGATAAQAVLGAGFSVTRARGTRVESPWAPVVMATVHPAAILRARERAEREAGFDAFVADLAAMWAALDAR